MSQLSNSHRLEMIVELQVYLKHSLRKIVVFIRNERHPCGCGKVARIARRVRAAHHLFPRWPTDSLVF